MNWLYTLVFAGLAFSTQSTPVTKNSLIDTAPAALVSATDETERFEQTYPFNAGGRVHVSNVNGSITMEAWDRNEIKLVYTKTAESRERLADVEVQIEATQDRFEVETDYGNWKRDNGGWRNNGKINVDFQLMVPRGAFLSDIETVNGSVSISNFTNRMSVSAVNGSVDATNIRGTARLSTVNGEARAEFDRLEPGSKISLETVNGKANLVIPSDASATIRAESVNGNITNDFGLPVRKGKFVGRDLYGRVGTGDVQIKLESVNGALTISRKNDGRTVSPATDLLPQKDNDDEDWDDDDSMLDTARMNKEIAKSVKDSTKATAKAMAETKVKIGKLEPEIAKITAQSIEQAAKAVEQTSEYMRSDEFRDSVRELQRSQEVIARMGDAVFSPGVPRIEKRSDSITVKGTPKVKVDARGCSVHVLGWDKSEVQYRITQYSDPRRQTPVNINESHTDKSVTLNIENAGEHGVRQVRIEIYVPKRSDLDIDSDGEIRIEGVSGELQLKGADESINVRDVDGSLTVANADGRIRVIGFHGNVDAKSGDGSISLEGEFGALRANTDGGNVIVTVPEGTGADLDSNCDAVVADGMVLERVDVDSERSHYKIGSGGTPFLINAGGEIRIRSLASLKANS